MVEYNTELRRGLWCFIDTVTGDMTFQVRYDVDDLLSVNDKIRNEAVDPKTNKLGDWVHTASIPVGKYHADLDEALDNDDDKYFRRYLNDPDNRRLRTSRTRV